MQTSAALLGRVRDRQKEERFKKALPIAKKNLRSFFDEHYSIDR